MDAKEYDNKQGNGQGKKHGNKNSNLLKWDVAVCFILPFFIWRWIAPQIGDRNTIILMACIGLIYSIVDFMKTRQFNFIVIYSLSLSICSSAISILTVNTNQLMLNFIYFNILTIAIQLGLWIFIKPVPTLYLESGMTRFGFSKENSNWYFKQSFFNKPIVYMAIAYIGKDIFDALIRVYFLNNLSDSAYSNMSQITSVVGTVYSIAISYWIFTLISKSKRHINVVFEEIEENQSNGLVG